MDKNVFYFIFIAVCFQSISCKTSIESKNQTSVHQNIDTTLYLVDTVMNQVNLDNQVVSIKLMRSKLDEHRKPFDSILQSPVSLTIFPVGDSEAIYFKHFDTEPDDYPYTTATLFKANELSPQASGPLFFSLEKGYGGSGSTYQLYLIQALNKVVTLTELFKGIGELSYPYFLGNGKQLLVLESVWNIAKGESHFSDHQIKITAITLTKGSPRIQNIGKSKYKYFLPYNNQMADIFIKEVQIKEPQLLRSLNF